MVETESKQLRIERELFGIPALPSFVRIIYDMGRGMGL